jgi:hypothetical protein
MCRTLQRAVVDSHVDILWGRRSCRLPKNFFAASSACRVDIHVDIYTAAVSTVNSPLSSTPAVPASTIQTSPVLVADPSISPIPSITITIAARSFGGT